MKTWLLALLALAPLPALAEIDHAALAERALNETILPGFERLAEATGTLAGAAEAACARTGPIEIGPVQSGFDDAFDAWIGVEAFRFGPAQENNSGFALAFWPDTKGSTPRTLGAMIAAEDPVVDDPAAFAGLSVAARGFFALDWLLFDPSVGPIEAGSYQCRLLVAITRDAAATSAKLLARWQDPWAGILTSAGEPGNPVYFAPDEASRALYAALTEALQFDIDVRLGRPLGTFERPQPRRAEAWRSGRSLRNVNASLVALKDFTRRVFEPALPATEMDSVIASFDGALAAVQRVQGPIDVEVATSQGRVHVEALQSSVRGVQTQVAEHVGPGVGVSAGFNSMDGD